MAAKPIGQLCCWSPIYKRSPDVPSDVAFSIYLTPTKYWFAYDNILLTRHKKKKGHLGEDQRHTAAHYELSHWLKFPNLWLSERVNSPLSSKKQSPTFCDITFEDDMAFWGREPHGPSITEKSCSSLANAITTLYLIIKLYLPVTSQHACNFYSSEVFMVVVFFLILSFHYFCLKIFSPFLQKLLAISQSSLLPFLSERWKERNMLILCKMEEGRVSCHLFFLTLLQVVRTREPEEAEKKNFNYNFFSKEGEQIGRTDRWEAK